MIDILTRSDEEYKVSRLKFTFLHHLAILGLFAGNPGHGYIQSAKNIKHKTAAIEFFRPLPAPLVGFVQLAARQRGCFNSQLKIFHRILNRMIFNFSVGIGSWYFSCGSRIVIDLFGRL